MSEPDSGPIETAPRDGRYFIAYGPAAPEGMVIRCVPERSQWEDRDRTWWEIYDYEDMSTPMPFLKTAFTSWRTLPPPPETL
jgi:hypothetical protein